MSQRRACRVVGISDSVYRYQPDAHRDDEVIMTLQEAVERYPAYGFSKLFKILRRWGHGWNHKRVYRLYCLLNLQQTAWEEAFTESPPRAPGGAGPGQSLLVDGLYE